MVYKFVFFSDEVDSFCREIKIDSDATFFQLHEAILDAVGYTKDQMTSFFLCNERWEKEQEITLFEMDSSSEYDNLVMDQVVLRDLVTDEKQRLLYVFDNISDRAFFLELREIIFGSNLASPICSLSKGNPPRQIVDIEDYNSQVKSDLDADFYGEDGFNEDELDAEGFDNLDIDENKF